MKFNDLFIKYYMIRNFIVINIISKFIIVQLDFKVQ